MEEKEECIDQKRFFKICQKMDSIQQKRNGIGTLGEKTIHAMLKQYYEPDEQKQEIRMGNYIADIFTGTEIIEIQTRQLYKLQKKLSVFLQDYPVTVVYPIAGKRWIYWVDPKTGEISNGRISPKHGNVFDAFSELYKIKNFLIMKGITIRIPLITVREYKCLDGWSQDRKRGAHRMDRVPLQLEEEAVLCSEEDYAKLIPQTLTEDFTFREFALAAKIRKEVAQDVVHVLWFVGVLQRIGRKGQAYIYQRKRK